MRKKVRVLIVDDSALVRQRLSQVLSADPEIEIMATAGDPFIAANKLASEIPDVITLDVEMPKMDGITFLRRIMSQHPIPVVIISSLTEKGTETALRALEYGAVDIIPKSQLGIYTPLEDQQTFVCDVIKVAAGVKPKRKSMASTMAITPKLSSDVILKPVVNRSMIQTTEKVVAVGASTGGTEALRVFLEALPLDSPGIVIVQHMPEMFTRSFANRLNSICKVSVKEARHGDTVIPGHVLIAPGNRHMLVKRSGARYYVEINDGPPVNRHRPSVDVLFRSVAQYAGRNSLGIIMTGMGDDGAKGLLEMKTAGALTIAQDEKTSVVFGMPREAIRLGAATKILPLDDMAAAVMKA